MEIVYFLIGVVVIGLVIAYRNGSFQRSTGSGEEITRSWQSSRAHGGDGHGFDYESDRFGSGGGRR